MTTCLTLDYGTDVEAAVATITGEIHRHPEIAELFPDRWLALVLLQDGDDLRERLAEMPGGPGVLGAADAARSRLAETLGPNAVIAVADRRYAWINQLVNEVVEQPADVRTRRSDRIDRILTHRLLGIPFFLAAMWIVFQLTANVSAVFLDWIDSVVNGPVARWVAAGVAAVGLGDTWVEGLLVDGVVAGVGGILVFIPVLLTLYLALAVLEDSGYMARAALVMDRGMRALGLPGKSFLPMLVGFGCTVPAIYATRTLERRRDRLLTGLLVPFMSCGARLPVYVLIASVFFPRHRGTVVFGMYLLGIAVAVVLGFLLNRTMFRKDPPLPLVMELPPYRRPTFRGIWPQVRQRIVGFVKDAGTIILGTSVALWLLLSIPIGSGDFAEVEVEDSAFGRAADAAAPAFAPAGFDSWEPVGSLATGFVAKEVVVTSLAQVYGVADETEEPVDHTFLGDLREIGTGFLAAARDTLLAVPGIVGIDLLDEDAEPESTHLMTAIETGFERSSGGHGAAAGLAFLVFVLLYTPCMTAVAAERRELGTKWMWTSIIGQTGLAWVMAVLVFQVGRLLGGG